ncbi:MAG TPA: VOC family protein [Thermoplasmata archaeon]|nr:VOC family protein [Thermoplasmata archaeon]
MLDTAKVMAFVATKDTARARTFYEKTLGLRLVADDSFALVFDANGTMLRVQKVNHLTPDPFTALGWQVQDLRESIQTLVKKGVAFERFGIPAFPQDELGIWTADDGKRVAWFKDPDGNILSLTQFPSGH